MHLKKDQIERLSEKIVTDLSETETITLKADRKTIFNTVAEVIRKNLEAELQLEADAERLLDQTLRASGTVGIDRHKMLKMIKDKLAKERNFVL